MENRRKLEEVKQAMRKAKSRRMYERYQALYLHLQGSQVKDIAHALNRSPQTIKEYKKAYGQKGIAGLEMKHLPGAPIRVTKK